MANDYIPSGEIITGENKPLSIEKSYVINFVPLINRVKCAANSLVGISLKIDAVQKKIATDLN